MYPPARGTSAKLQKSGLEQIRVHEIGVSAHFYFMYCIKAALKTRRKRERVGI
jgi:hypothetical protein